MDVGDLDLANRRGVVTFKGGALEWVTWHTGTARLLPRLLKGHREGPVFTTRAPSRIVVAKLDQAPDGTARLSYRRAEELLKAAAGFADVSVTFTHQVADGLHSAIIKASKPVGVNSAVAAAVPASRTTLPLASDSACR